MPKKFQTKIRKIFRRVSQKIKNTTSVNYHSVHNLKEDEGFLFQDEIKPKSPNVQSIYYDNSIIKYISIYQKGYLS